MNCDQVCQNDIVEKYLLGKLSQGDQEAYELHYFECARCFDQLEAHQLIHAELERSAAAIQAEDLPKRAVWRWVWAPVAAMAVLIVSLGIWKGWLQRGTNTGPQVAVRGTQQAPNTVASLSLLASVEPPPYQPLTLRGNQDEATRQFELAMQDYLKNNYEAAVPGLRAALKLDPEATDARFYLGICYLLIDQTDRAIVELRHTVALGDSPYLDGAHFYLAKAYIRESDSAAAEEQLNETVKLHRHYEASAKELLLHLQSLRRARP